MAAELDKYPMTNYLNKNFIFRAGVGVLAVFLTYRISLYLGVRSWMPGLGPDFGCVYRLRQISSSD